MVTSLSDSGGCGGESSPLRPVRSMVFEYVADDQARDSDFVVENLQQVARRNPGVRGGVTSGVRSASQPGGKQIFHLKTKRREYRTHCASAKVVNQYATIVQFADGQGG
jgi:hypothetical protein